MSKPSLAALLLAGGESRRMGSPKLALDFHGRPLWRVQLEKLRELKPAELFLSVPTGTKIAAGDFSVLHDEDPGLGPLAGLAAAYQAMSADRLVVLAVDLPAMTSSYLQQMIAEALETGKGIVPQLDDFYLGLGAVYPRSFLATLGDHLKSADRSLQGFVREGIAAGQLAARPVKEDVRHLFTDTDDPAAYAAALARAQD